MDQHTLLLAAVPVTGFVAGFINTFVRFAVVVITVGSAVALFAGL